MVTSLPLQTLVFSGGVVKIPSPTYVSLIYVRIQYVSLKASHFVITVQSPFHLLTHFFTYIQYDSSFRILAIVTK